MPRPCSIMTVRVRLVDHKSSKYFSSHILPPVACMIRWVISIFSSHILPPVARMIRRVTSEPSGTCGRS